MMLPWVRTACMAVLISLAAANVCSGDTVPAVTIVAPPHCATNAGGYMDDAPLGYAGNQHFQQIYAPSLLADIQVGSLITGVGFRVPASGTNIAAQVVPNYQIWLSQAANIPAEMSTTFSANRGSDFTLVKSGTLTITEGMFSAGETISPFGFIEFSTPYTYLGGSLLVEISYENFSVGGVADSVYPISEGVARTGFNNSTSGTVADALFGEAIVMAFQVVQVPEPSFVFSLAGGILLLLLYTRNRR